MPERLALLGAEQSVGDAAHVSRDLLLDPALEAGLRPAALGVPAVKLIVDARELAQTARAAAKQPRRPAAHDRDAPVARRDLRRERLKPWHQVDHRERLHRASEPHRLEDAGLRRGEDRQAPRATPDRPIGGEPCLDAVSVPIGAFPPGLVEQRSELRLPGVGGGEASRIQVEVDAEDGRPVRVQAREPLDRLGIECAIGCERCFSGPHLERAGDVG